MGYETRLTANGKPLEPKLVRTGSLSYKKANVHPHLIRTTSRSVQIILVVFESRRAIPVFRSFCNP